MGDPAAPLGFRLGRLSLGARLGITGFLLVLLGGYAASLAYLVEHYHNRDEDPALAVDDFVAGFHGLEKHSALKDALEGAHGREHMPDAAEREYLLAWLAADDVGAGYDAIDDQDRCPADLLDQRCISCHRRNGDAAKIAGGEHSALALDNWPDVEAVASSKEFLPVRPETLVVSLHVHASMLPVLGLVVAALCLAAGGRRVPGLLIGGAGLGLLLDLGSMWLARQSAAFVPVMLVGGALFGVCLCLQILWILVELWGRRSGG